MNEPSAPNPTATAKQNNKNEVVMVNFELVCYEIVILMYKLIFLLDQE
jgi:hypothetical protein